MVRHDALKGNEVEIDFDAPTKDWSSRRTGPSVDLYLYDVREDLRFREYGLVDMREADGLVTGRVRPSRRFKLSYLVTAWTQRPEDEHHLLAALLGCFVAHDHIPTELLASPLDRLTDPVPFTIALPPPQDRALNDVWSALGGELKPSLDLVVYAPWVPAVDEDIAPPVQGPLTMDMVRLTDGVTERPVMRRQRRTPPSSPPSMDTEPATGRPGRILRPGKAGG